MVQVLALLFMARADVGYTVRQAAVHVWKTIVTNTPRTTGEILKTLMEQIITSLGHPSRPMHHTFALPLLGHLHLPVCNHALLSPVLCHIPVMLHGDTDASSTKHQAAMFH